MTPKGQLEVVSLFSEVGGFDLGFERAGTHRYRFMGNAVTVNVAEWIGRRIVHSDAHWTPDQ